MRPCLNFFFFFFVVSQALRAESIMLHIYIKDTFVRCKCPKSAPSLTHASPILLQDLPVAIQFTPSAGAQGSCRNAPFQSMPIVNSGLPASKLCPCLHTLPGLWPHELALIKLISVLLIARSEGKIQPSSVWIFCYIWSC